MDFQDAFSKLDSPGVVGAICVLLGSVLTQIYNNRNKIEDNNHKLRELEQVDGIAIRKELMEMLQRTEERWSTKYEKLELSHNEWQQRYYKDTTELKSEIAVVRAELQAMAALVADGKAKGLL